MKLSELAYQCVKNVYYTSNTSFTYDLFKVGEYDNDSEFDLEISNVFSPINEAISRLNNLNKIPHLVEKVQLNSEKSATLPSTIISIVGVGDLSGNIKSYEFVESGNKVFVKTNKKYVYIEGKRKIPYFTKDSYYIESLSSEIPENIIYGNDESTNDRDIDLFEEYGITDEMCSYIIEYVAGRLWEVSNTSIANMHRTIAEHYFSDLPDKEVLFRQKIVETNYKIGY